MNKRTREERTVTIDPSSICLDGTDKGPQVVRGRRPLLSREEGQFCAGDRPTVGLILVREPLG